MLSESGWVRKAISHLHEGCSYLGAPMVAQDAAGTRRLSSDLGPQERAGCREQGARPCAPEVWCSAAAFRTPAFPCHGFAVTMSTERHRVLCCAGAWGHGGEESCPPAAPPHTQCSEGPAGESQGRQTLSWKEAGHGHPPYLWESPAWPTWSLSSDGR